MKAFVKAAPAIAAAVLTPLVAAGPAFAAPVYTPPDGGVDNCQVFSHPSVLTGYIGSPTPQPYRPFTDSLTEARKDNWCSVSYGDGSLRFAQDGLTLAIPPTPSADALASNAEIVAHSEVHVGNTVTMKVDGRGLAGLNGTSGWGMATRIGDPGPLETAWFFYNDTDSGLGDLSEVTKPVFAALGSDLPRGLFIMTKPALGLPVIRLIDSSYLGGEHSYSVRLNDGTADFFIDGESVGTLSNAPTGRAIDWTRQHVPLVGQMWVDGNFWFPYPIPQHNPVPHSARLNGYEQGPNGQTPLVIG